MRPLGLNTPCAKRRANHSCRTHPLRLALNKHLQCESEIPFLETTHCILIYHLFAIAHAGEASSSCKHLGGSARCCPRCAHAQAHSGQFSRPKRCNRPTYVKQTSGKSLNLPLAEKQLNTRKHLLLTPRTGLWLSSYKHAMK